MCPSMWFSLPINTLCLNMCRMESSLTGKKRTSIHSLATSQSKSHVVKRRCTATDNLIAQVAVMTCCIPTGCGMVTDCCQSSAIWRSVPEVSGCTSGRQRKTWRHDAWTNQVLWLGHQGGYKFKSRGPVIYFQEYHLTVSVGKSAVCSQVDYYCWKPKRVV